MKKEILEALTTKFAGVSAAILDRVATKLAKTVTTAEQVQTAVEGVTFQQVLESYGDSRATEATQSAVSNYEKKYGLKDGKTVQGGGGQQQEPAAIQQGGDLSAAVAAAVEAAIKPLQEEITNFKMGRITESRKQQYGAIIGRLPEGLRKGYNRVSVDKMSDDEFSAFLTEVKGEVDAIAADTKAKGAVLGRPLNNAKAGAQTDKKVATAEETDAVMKHLSV